MSVSLALHEAVRAPRTLKIFLSSPSDVIEERDSLAQLVKDINDVLAFLAPEKRLTLELVRYETHAYPDIGQPQEVINRQVPIDYDIFVGVMWKRCGTPTANAPSGTIEEFRRAFEHRKTGHLPRIMFYFCEEAIQIPPNPEDLEQLAGVVKFRNELASLGLISTYPKHCEFTEHLRGGLLRAIRDILLEESNAPPAEIPARQEITVDAGSEREILDLAAEYERIRREMPASGSRTSQMAGVFARMKAKAARVQPLLSKFEKGSSPGARLAAIAILQMFPDEQHLDWLAVRLDPEEEKPFIGYQAAVALAEAVRGLSCMQAKHIRDALTEAKRLAQRLQGDPARISVLENAEEELQRKCGP
jgi:hypothetical protein